MKKNILLIILTIFFLTKCKPVKRENVILEKKDLAIKISAPDTAFKDQMYCAYIYVTDMNFKLLFAHLNCNVTDSTTVDTTRTRIRGCSKNLFIEHDTVKICFEPTVSGKYSFDEITLLAKNNQGKYFFKKCSFDYYVK